MDAILDRAPPAGPFRRCDVQVLPVDEVLSDNEDPRLEGIALDADRPSEDASLHRQSFDQYTRQLQERAMCR